MNLEELEAHLIELQEKNMETRGVLRRLIQLHASKGNFERVRELRQLFIDSGYCGPYGFPAVIYRGALFADMRNRQVLKAL